MSMAAPSTDPATGSSEERSAPAAARPAGRRHRVRHALEYALFRLLLGSLSGLGEGGTRRLGRVLGWAAFELFRIRRRVTLENLAHAFPSLTAVRRRQIARKCYLHFGVTFLELLRLPRLSPGEIRRRIPCASPEPFDELRSQGKGGVLVTGHLGNWELLGAGIAALGYPLRVTVASQRNRRVDAYVTRARESAGMRVLKIEAGLRPILRALRGNEFVAFVSDQDAGRHGCFVPLFGRPASTALGPARFARLARCPILVGFGIRGPESSYEMKLSATIHVREDLPEREAEEEATRRIVEILETEIRRHPEQWFWMHRRWKTRPAPRTDRPGNGEGRRRA